MYVYYSESSSLSKEMKKQHDVKLSFYQHGHLDFREPDTKTESL